MRRLKSGAFTARYHRSRNKTKRGSAVNQRILDTVTAIIPAGQTVIDIGAGNGKYVKALRDAGYAVTGIDGTPDIGKETDGLVDRADLTEDCSEFFGMADWGLFLEVGEHVPLEYEQKMIDTVSRIPTAGLIVSWSDGRGCGHVNKRPPDYVAAEFARRGWALDKAMMKKVKYIMDRDYRRRLLILRKES